jgi:glutamine synthetase
MEESDFVADVLGEQVFEIFLRNKRAEWNEYRLQVTPHELKRNIGIL